ncbi:4Fe-4S binding protein [Xiamenia xianingshaonis]|uniref:4Fe-4S dicluster domain-containing protein n=1 Tax=Xiamenia xianingshaonis TaxID=2682776 RepID=A0ABX0IHT9_9ACTN|nr:4Fe-4S binding protein [Xiamenia xianingshaonis]NHM13602.1 4Fe-4S dicluster domain-containing protein [Xiamenia xianingshaonis]
MYGPPRFSIGSGGVVCVDEPRCIGCGLCVRACPTKHILEVSDQDSKRITVARPHLCTGCGCCVTSCPRSALRVQPRDL